METTVATCVWGAKLESAAAVPSSSGSGLVLVYQDPELWMS